MTKHGRIQQQQSDKRFFGAASFSSIIFGSHLDAFGFLTATISHEPSGSAGAMTPATNILCMASGPKFLQVIPWGTPWSLVSLEPL
jgi:hypothetical protein